MKLENKLKEVKNKVYEVYYDEEKKNIKKRLISGGEIKKNYFLLNNFDFLEYNCILIQYTIDEDEIKNNYLKIIGILFNKNNKTEYSLDLVNKNNTNLIELQLNNYENNSTEIIEKFMEYPGNKNIIYYILEYLSNDKIKKIFN